MQTEKCCLMQKLSTTVQIPPWFDANILGGLAGGIAAGFKFHRGSMQTGGRTEAALCFPGSNSTVVRCKHRCSFAGRIWYCSFKFHRGSMQTFFLSMCLFLQPAFKFHRGSMQTWPPNVPFLNNITVQIPPWFDANVQEQKQIRIAEVVQIPPWFDANRGGD